MSMFGDSVPGLRTDRTYDPREFLVSGSTTPVELIPAGRTINASNSRDPGNSPDVQSLRPGLIMGKITANAAYGPSFFGLTTVAVAIGNAAITTSSAAATEIFRRQGGSTGTLGLVGAATTAGTVTSTTVTLTAINTTTGVLSIAPTASVAYVVGSFIAPVDGSQTPLCVLNNYRRVTDVDGNNIDSKGDLLVIGGFVDIAQLIPTPPTANTTQVAWLKGQLNSPTTGPGNFKFLDNF